MSALHNHGSILDTLGEHPTIAAPRPLFHFFTSLFHCFCDPNHGERTPPRFGVDPIHSNGLARFYFAHQ